MFLQLIGNVQINQVSDVKRYKKFNQNLIEQKLMNLTIFKMINRLINCQFPQR